MNSKNLVSQSNDLIEAKYIDLLSARQQKMVLAIVSMISPEDEDFKPYIISVKDFSEMMGLQGKPKYSEIRVITREMLRKVIEIPRGEGRTLQATWFSTVEYYEGEGLIEFSFDPKLKGFLLNLKAYTQYRLSNVLALGSSYSIRLYELMKKWENIVRIEYPVTQLKEKLGLEGKYKQYGHFKSRVIKPAIKDISDKTDINVTFKEIKKGKRIEKIEFTIRPKIKQTKNLKQQSNFDKELFEKLNELSNGYNLSFNAFEKIEQIAKTIYSDDKYIKQLERLIEVTNSRVKQGNINNPVGLLIKIIKDKENLFNKGDNPYFEDISAEVVPDWFSERKKSKKEEPESAEQQKQEQHEMEELKRQIADFRKETEDVGQNV